MPVCLFGLVDVWQWTQIVYSGQWPPAIYEAANASQFMVLRTNLPLLKEIIAIAFIIRFMDVRKVYVMTWTHSQQHRRN